MIADTSVIVDRTVFKSKADWVDAARLQPSSAIFYWGEDSATMEIYGIKGAVVSKGLWVSKKDEKIAECDAIGFIDYPINCYPAKPIRNIQNAAIV